MAQKFVICKYYHNGGTDWTPIKVNARLYDWDVALLTNAPFGYELASSAPDMEMRDQEGRRRRTIDFWDSTNARSVKVVCPSETAKLWDKTLTSVTSMPIGGPNSTATLTASPYARQGERVRAARHFGRDS